MEQKLSKYDVLSNKMNKLSKIVISFFGAYSLAFSVNKKKEVIKKFIEKILCDFYILLEIKKDFNDYLLNSKVDDKTLEFFNELNATSSELEKILILYEICRKKEDDFMYQLIIDFVSKKITEDQLLSHLNNNLGKEDREVLKILVNEDYSFEKLPIEYQKLIIESHNKFITKNINPYVNKKEKKEIEILKGIKIYKENIDVDFKVKLNEKIKSYK